MTTPIHANSWKFTPNSGEIKKNNMKEAMLASHEPELFSVHLSHPRLFTLCVHVQFSHSCYSCLCLLAFTMQFPFCSLLRATTEREGNVNRQTKSRGGASRIFLEFCRLWPLRRNFLSCYWLNSFSCGTFPFYKIWNLMHQEEDRHLLIPFKRREHVY